MSRTGLRGSTRARWGMRALFLALLAAAAVLACRAGAGAERAWSVQLHVHGSFSEGLGSIDSHDHEARSVGCDVVWWSDHDFRLLTYEHVARFGFESWTEPLERNEAWTTLLAKYRGDQKGVKPLGPAGPRAGASFTSERAREGQHSLRLVQQSDGPEFTPLLFGFGAERRLERRSLATGVTLRLAVFPEELPAGARVVVRAGLSEHAPRDGGDSFPVESVRYEGTPAGGAPGREGSCYRVPVSCEPGRWNELALPLSADAVRGFPESPGEDNALVELALGLETKDGASAVACFDDLRIEQERSGPPVFARQAQLIAEVGELYPGLAQLQGVEISYDSRHLNLFCEETPLPDYAALARDCPRDADDRARLDPRAFRQRVCDWAIAAAHEAGGLVSYNHPFGATFEDDEKPRTNEEQLAILLRNHAEGADLLEVGYRERGGATLDDHLWLWDHAALSGLRLVGVGVSDSHGGPENRWRGSPNNLVSWIWARSSAKRDLIEGLRAGRVFFGDLTRFQGTLDFALDTGECMGATVRDGRAAAVLELALDGAVAGEELVTVESGARTARTRVDGPRFRHAFRVALPEERDAFVRFELCDASGPIALTNPIHFLRRAEAR